MTPPAVRVLSVKVVVLARMYDHGDFAAARGTLGLKGRGLEFGNIFAHQTFNNPARAALRFAQRVRVPVDPSRLVIQQLTRWPLPIALCQLRGVKNIHPIRPAVVRCLYNRVLIVFVGVIGRLVARQW